MARHDAGAWRPCDGEPRRRKSAAERREQARRSEGRACLRLIRSLVSIRDHRGNHLGAVGEALLEVMVPSIAAAHGRNNKVDPSKWIDFCDAEPMSVVEKDHVDADIGLCDVEMSTTAFAELSVVSAASVLLAGDHNTTVEAVADPSPLGVVTALDVSLAPVTLAGAPASSAAAPKDSTLAPDATEVDTELRSLRSRIITTVVGIARTQPVWGRGIMNSMKGLDAAGLYELAARVERSRIWMESENVDGPT
jgi:hypothetical protein